MLQTRAPAILALLAGLAIFLSSVLARGAAAGDVVSTGPPAVFNVMTSDFPKTPRANVRVFVGTLTPGALTFWHTHSSPPVVYVVSGTGTWEYHGRRRPDIRQAGQVMFEPANIAVRLVNHGTTPVRVVMFSVTKPGEPFLRPSR